MIAKPNAMSLFSKFAIDPIPVVSFRQRFAESLCRLLNTRRTYGDFLPDFGVADLSDIPDGQALRACLAREISEVLTHYEHRFTPLAVEAEQAPSGFRFRVDGRFLSHSPREPVASHLVTFWLTHDTSRGFAAAKA
ncbi:GPW/gp25 family protein [Desulfoluna spongiiphila]|uniref:GPW/gp25 family protein n=1 Tax=Desulfoluna spongiiphila TaxID=419481 RepID=UPI00125C1826|nr:GPW/gp25 family protein [Desulfoluna spongiiphila]VVS95579.1 gpw/gp25/anti-adapter protein irad [Desulfoluna spongiiphila]